ATRLWQDKCSPSNMWADARDFIAHIGPRTARTETVRLSDGRALCCRIQAIGGGGTLIGFRAMAPVEPSPA
ncbi:diguanylate cyclase, partial [Escherichia coli]|nr:diguanylate cyclase [Escherichia coli]